jgi:hypothetical protein
LEILWCCPKCINDGRILPNYFIVFISSEWLGGNECARFDEWVGEKDPHCAEEMVITPDALLFGWSKSAWRCWLLRAMIPLLRVEWKEWMFCWRQRLNFSHGVGVLACSSSASVKPDFSTES